MRCSIPGLCSEMELVFPSGKLPVCERCKRVYKTRKLCREHDGHTAFPWNKMYICFILDDSCFAIDEKGNECLVREDGPNPHDFFAKSIENSNTKKYFASLDTRDKLAPVCTQCKVKGYTTRPHCRTKHGLSTFPGVRLT